MIARNELTPCRITICVSCCLYSMNYSEPFSFINMYKNCLVLRKCVFFEIQY